MTVATPYQNIGYTNGMEIHIINVSRCVIMSICMNVYIYVYICIRIYVYVVYQNIEHTNGNPYRQRL